MDYYMWDYGELYVRLWIAIYEIIDNYIWDYG